jgi:hypothetical protein
MMVRMFLVPAFLRCAVNSLNWHCIASDYSLIVDTTVQWIMSGTRKMLPRQSMHEENSGHLVDQRHSQPPGAG